LDKFFANYVNQDSKIRFLIKKENKQLTIGKEEISQKKHNIIWRRLSKDKRKVLLLDNVKNGGTYSVSFSNQSLIWSRCNIWDKDFLNRLNKNNNSFDYQNYPIIDETKMSYLDYFINIYLGQIVLLKLLFPKQILFGSWFVGLIILYFCFRWKPKDKKTKENKKKIREDVFNLRTLFITLVKCI